MENRIWGEGEGEGDGLTWSTITELLGEDAITPIRLQHLVLDLTDSLAVKEAELAELSDQAVALQNKIGFLRENVAACLGFGVKRLGYPKVVKYLHDREPKTVKVSVVDSEVIIEIEPLTVAPNYG